MFMMFEDVSSTPWYLDDALKVDGVLPTMIADFSTGVSRIAVNGVEKTFSQLFDTFTCDTTRTRVNSLGKVVAVAANTPAICYKSGYGELLIGPAATNLVPYSNTAAQWTFNGTGASYADGGESCIDGANCTLWTVGTSTDDYWVAPLSVDIADSKRYYGGVHIAAGTGRYVRVDLIYDRFGSAYYNFDLQTGTITDQTGCNPVVYDLGGGWFKLGISDVSGSAWAGMVPLKIAALTTGAETGNLPPDITGTGQTYKIAGFDFYEGNASSSYIPTNGATASIAATVCESTGTAFSDWYTSITAGTIFVESTQILPRSYAGCVELMQDAGNKYACFHANSTTEKYRFTSVVGGEAQFDSTPDKVTTHGSPSKKAMAIASNNTIACVEGTLGSVDTSFAVPPVNLMRVGNNTNNSAYGTGGIKQIRFYPIRALDASLQALTT